MDKFYTNVSQDKNYVLVRGYNKDGESFYDRIAYSPSIYVSSNSGSYKALHGGILSKKEFDTIHEFYDFLRKYKDINNYVHGLRDIPLQFIHENYNKQEYDLSLIRTIFLDIECLAGNSFPDPQKAQYPITAICLYDSKDKKFKMITSAKWSKDNSKFQDLAENTEYYYCQNERELLIKFLSIWEKSYPDVITGWNVEKFDLVYIIRRFEQVIPKQENRLSPYSKISRKNVVTKYGEEVIYSLQGISTLDYLDLYKKFRGGNPESMKLDFIGKLELNEQKVQFKGTYKEFYENEPQLFIDYNIKDVDIVRRLDEKLHLLNLVYNYAYQVGTNYSNTLGTTLPWTSFIYGACLEKGIIIPYSTERKRKEAYEGAYVFPTQEGLTDIVASFDINSMYPNIIISLNISPETLIQENIREQIISEIINVSDKEFQELARTRTPFIEYYLKNGMPSEVISVLEKYNVSMAPNWEFYTRKFTGILPELVSEIYKGRVTVKSEMKVKKRELENLKENNGDSTDIQRLEGEVATLDISQHTKKIMLNSLYGAMGCEYFQFFDTRHARAITLTGQLFIRTIAQWVSEHIVEFSEKNKLKVKDKGNPPFIISGDTDSVTGDTEIYLYDKKIKISDLYKFYFCGDTVVLPNGNNVKVVHGPSISDGYYTYGLNENKEVEKTPIRYISKHKVKKKFYKLKYFDKEVTVTEDHSIMVMRNNEVISVKPKDILKNDELIIFQEVESDKYGANNPYLKQITEADAIWEKLRQKNIELVKSL